MHQMIIMDMNSHHRQIIISHQNISFARGAIMTTQMAEKTILQYLIEDQPLVHGERRLSGYVTIRGEAFLDGL